MLKLNLSLLLCLYSLWDQHRHPYHHLTPHHLRTWAMGHFRWVTEYTEYTLVLSVKSLFPPFSPLFYLLFLRTFQHSHSREHSPFLSEFSASSNYKVTAPVLAPITLCSLFFTCVQFSSFPPWLWLSFLLSQPFYLGHQFSHSTPQSYRGDIPYSGVPYVSPPQYLTSHGERARVCVYTLSWT